ncbi:MAG: metallophosphoesterase family protein [Bacteroidetes bacterium]|nr:metallophosphoesterase family protein [Bacteroidota bacterium]
MTLGILSDTHGYFHPALAEDLADVDLILHAGDVGRAEILDRLEALAPTRAVWGNIDGPDLRQRTPEHQRFDLDGLSFWMTHIAGRPGRWQRGMGQALRQQPPNVFICGHSHILQIERVAALDGMLFINPGAAGRQGLHQVKTCVRLHLEDGATRQAEVIHLDE